MCEESGVTGVVDLTSNRVGRDIFRSRTSVESAPNRLRTRASRPHKVKSRQHIGTKKGLGHVMSPCWLPWVCCQRLFYTIHVLYKHIQS